MIKITLTKEEASMLEAHYKNSGSRLIRERAHASLLSNKGYSVPEIARILMRSEDAARAWLKSFASIRIASIFHKYDDNMNASKLTKEQRKEISTTLRKYPSQNGLSGQFWSLPALKKYISAKFGVIYESDRSYHYLLQYAGLSWKLPSPFDKRRDDKFVKRRMTEIKEEIDELSKNTIILSADETRINWETETRRAWLKKGEKTVIKVTRDKIGQSYFGAWNHRSKKCHLIPLSWQNQETTIKALKKIKRFYRNRNIAVIWDNARWHKGKKLREQLKKGKSLHNIHLINYPPYAPDTNPQEHIWKYGKDMISNQTFETFDGLKKCFESSIRFKMFDYKSP